MAINLLKDKGTPLDKQNFSWKDLVRPVTSKLDDDAFTRVRVILMNGIESESIRFSHALARFHPETQLAMAEIRRAEQHQETLVNWLLPADLSPLETTIAYEQVAVEVTANLAYKEPDPYIAAVMRFGLLEDFDHLYRYAALMDRLTGMDANNILQSYTDIRPGRPTSEEHRAPADDLRNPYRKDAAKLLTKLHSLTIVAGEYQTHDYYMNVGPAFSDPVARRVYAEIASIEEQHVTQYESMIDPNETWLEKWLLHEATEVYNYSSCVEYETNPRIKAVWERFLDYELGHLARVREIFEDMEKRDAAEILSAKLPDSIDYRAKRDFVREVLGKEADLRAKGPDFVPKSKEGRLSRDYRRQMNADGSPTEAVAAGYQWAPGTSLASPDLLSKAA
jgi:rubrerythrin